MTRYVFEYHEIFEDIPGDPDNILFNIPQVITEHLGLDEGDTIVIECINQSLVIRKKGDNSDE